MQDNINEQYKPSDEGEESRRIYYVYYIWNKKLNRYYIGYRLCPNGKKPVNDIGVKYFSSSHNKDFIDDQINNKSDYHYGVLKTFTNKNDALSFEIFLHKKYDVGVNEKFYNNAIQTSNKFDRTGIKQTKEHIEKRTQSYKNNIANINKRKGKPLTKEHRLKIGLARKGIPHTEETKKRLSEIIKKRWKITPHPMLGKTHTEETRRKLSIASTGKTLSVEARRKISEANKGENHPMYGKTHTEEVRTHISQKMRSLIRIKNDELGITKYHPKSEPIPEGWEIGINIVVSEEAKHNMSISHKGMVWIKNEKTKESKQIHLTDDGIPEGWTLGRLLDFTDEYRNKMSKSAKGKIWIKNTETNQCTKIKKDDPIPEGWTRGRLNFFPNKNKEK